MGILWRNLSSPSRLHLRPHGYERFRCQRNDVPAGWHGHPYLRPHRLRADLPRRVARQHCRDPRDRPPRGHAHCDQLPDPEHVGGELAGGVRRHALLGIASVRD